MSGASERPILTPDTITVGKEQVVIVEFQREFPQRVLVTFNFYYSSTGKKVSTVPTVSLGPHTVKAKFPEFSKTGEVDVVVHLSREESHLFPKFKVYIQSPLEAIFKSVPASPGSKQVALLAAAVAYITHCDEKDKDASAQADVILCDILKLVHHSEISDWCLSSLLAGKHGTEENLLHFCMRRKLGGVAELLLQSVSNSKKEAYLLQRSSDNRTPIELAHKNDMRRIAEMAESLIVSSGNKRSSTPKMKRKLGVERTKSVDSHLDHMCSPGNQDPTKLVTKRHTIDTVNKKKGGKAAKMLRMLKRDKEKGIVVSSPQTPMVNEFGEVILDPDQRMQSQTPPVPIFQHEEVNPHASAATWAATAHSSINKDETTYRLAGSYGMSPQGSPLLQSRRDHLPLPNQSSKTFPRNSRPGSHSESIASSNSSFDHGDSQFLQVEQQRRRPVSSSLSSGYGSGRSALSNAIKDLKSKALYVAEVVKEYNWISVSQGDFDCTLKVDDKVFVIQVGVEGNSQMCLGIWNGRYGKLPLSILRALPLSEMQRFNDEEDNVFEDNAGGDYEEIAELEDDESDIYKVPRNVPRPLFSGSESDTDDQPIYDVPPNRQHHVDYIDDDLSDGDYQNVPSRAKMHWLPVSKSHDSGMVQLDSPEGSIGHVSDDEPTANSISSLHPKSLFNDVHPNPTPKSSIGFEESCTPPLTRHRTQSGPPKAIEEVTSTPNETDHPPLKLATNKTESTQFENTLGGSTINEDGDSSPLYDDLDSAMSRNPHSEDIKKPGYEKIPHNKVQTELVKPPDSPQNEEECYDDIVDLAKKSHPEATNRGTELLHHGATSQHRAVTDSRATKRDRFYEDIDLIPDPGTEYHEITSVRNVLGQDGDRMTVGRVDQSSLADKAHTREGVILSDSDNVFSKQPTSPADVNSMYASPPKPRKRTRLVNKESPKPKPRRSTTGQQKDEQTSPPASHYQRKVVGNENGRQGNVGKIVNVEASGQSRTHVQLSPDQGTNRKAYVNLELKTSNRKPKAVPPPPPNRTTPYSPGTNQRKTQPPVAPKPQRKPHPSISSIANAH